MKIYNLRIKECRKIKGLTQAELAEMIGISRSFLSDIENQKFDISLSLLWRIGDALGECPHRLVDYNCCINCSIYCKNKP